MEIPPEALIVTGLVLGCLIHWFLESWRDHKITEPELKSLPSAIVMVACVAYLAVVCNLPALEMLKDPAVAFFAGFTIDSVFKNLFRIYENES